MPNARDLNGLTLNHANAVASAGTTNTLTTTVATTCSIGGKFATTYASGTNTATTMTTDAVTGAAFVTIPPNYCAALVIGINAAGVAKLCQGPLEPTETGVTTTVGAFKNPPQFPAMPSDFCPIAYTVMRVAPSLTAGATAGTTAWAATSVSCTTFQNISVLPDRPQLA